MLDDVQTDPLFNGCRHLTDYEEEKWITREEVFQGLKVLEDRGLTFDLPILYVIFLLFCKDKKILYPLINLILKCSSLIENI